MSWLVLHCALSRKGCAGCSPAAALFGAEERVDGVSGPATRTSRGVVGSLALVPRTKSSALGRRRASGGDASVDAKRSTTSAVPAGVDMDSRRPSGDTHDERRR
eukprot:Opistho-1_new@43042